MSEEKFKGPADNPTVFNEKNMNLSEEALKEIDEKWKDGEKDDNAVLDDEGNFQVPMPGEEPIKSKETNDGDKPEDLKKPDSETPGGEQPGDDGDKGGDEPPKITMKDLEDAFDEKEGTFDFEKFDMEVADPRDSEKTITLSELLSEFTGITEAHENDKGWKKSNTEKSQSLADDRKDLDGKVKAFDDLVGAANVEDAIKAINADTKLLSEMDAWFEGKENNPIRKILSAVAGLSGRQAEAKTKTDQTDQEAAEEIRKTIEGDIELIQAGDESYKNTDKLKALQEYAEKNYLRLPIAKIVMEHDGIVEAHDEMIDEIKTLTTELKTRNEEVNKLRKQIGIKETPPGGGKGPGKEEYSKPAGTWGEADDRIRKALG